MKKITSRFLALIVALCVLLTPAAMAEANPFELTLPEKNMATLTIGNFDLTMDDDIEDDVEAQSISLPLYLAITGGADIEGERGLVVLNLSTAEQSAATAYGVLENGEIKAYIDGMEYGFTLSLEEVAQMAEAELGAALTEVTEQLPEGFETALTNLMTSALAMQTAGEPDPAALMAALGVTAEEAGTAEVEILEETVTAQKMTVAMAPQTLSEYMDGMAAVMPAFGDYWTNYSELLNMALAESGEEMTIDEALAMLTMALDGEVYSTDTHLLAELTLSMSVEDETIQIPFSVSVADLGDRTQTDVRLSVDADGDTLLLSIYLDNTMTEEGSDLYANYSMYIVDGEDDETEEGFDISFSNVVTAEDVYYAVNMLFNDSFSSYNMGFEYFGLPAEITEDGDTSYSGMLGLYLSDGYSDYNLIMDTNLLLSTVPEGELLILPEGSIDVLEITDEQIEALETDIQVPVMQAAGVLMQDASLASMLLGAMN